MTTRLRPPNRRPSEHFDLDHGGQRYTIMTTDMNDKPIEVFITAHKVSSSIETVARDAAILISLALQYGAPLADLRNAVTREDDGSAATVVGAVLDAMSN